MSDRVTTCLEAAGLLLLVVAAALVAVPAAVAVAGVELLVVAWVKGGEDE